MKKILVVNAGSSTIKWKLFSKDGFEVIASGVADRIFVDGIIETKHQGGKSSRDISLKSHTDAANEIVADLEKFKLIENKDEIEYIGHRVVQGGTVYSETTKIDDQAIKTISDLSILAPLHNPGAVQALIAMKTIFPNAINTATFDTAFHATIPEINYTYPMNQELAKKHGIRKYGMHGTSHKFITRKLEEVLQKDKVNFVNLHIGNGASLCAVKDSKSFDTSMGLTPLAGIMMGTRSGDIDPSIHSFVCKQENIDIEEFDTILNKESGLKGVSGVSQDMRDITEAANNGNDQAAFTLDLYASKIADYTINYVNKIGSQVDALVFTAGVGENAAIIREKVVNMLPLLDLKLNKDKNEGKIGDVELISDSNSNIPIYVIRTDEELMIAKEALEV